MLGYSLTSAPLVVKDKVLVGITGGEFGARGFLDAYDAATGRRLWRWYAVPGPGEFGNDTWPGDSWKLGGSPMWLTGSVRSGARTRCTGRSETRDRRSIDRRAAISTTCSATRSSRIDPDTGQRKWHYQFTPNDGHDWDSAQDVMLVDRIWHGQMRKLLLHADRNGYFYVLDRTNGKFLSGTPFVYTNWNAGFDANGRPSHVPGSNSSRGRQLLRVSDRRRRHELPGAVVQSARPAGCISRIPRTASSTSARRSLTRRAGSTSAAPASRMLRRVRSRASRRRRPASRRSIPRPAGRCGSFKIFQGSLTNGVLATAGDVVFAAVRDGNLVALDARTGQHLWHSQTGGNMAASPISYAVDGRQFVAIAAGNMVHAFALPEGK